MSLSKFICMCCIALVTLSAVASEQRPTNQTQTKTQKYLLKGARCAFELTSTLAGSPYTDSSSEYFKFYEDYVPKKNQLMMEFRCMETREKDYCRNVWLRDFLTEGAPILPFINLVFYKSVHPVYKSVVYNISRNATDEPRARTVYFCLGHERKILEGRADVGVEGNEIPFRAINVIKTIRFLD